MLEDGTIGGLVFAESRTDDSVGYALTPTSVAVRVQPGIGRTGGVIPARASLTRVSVARRCREADTRGGSSAGTLVDSMTAMERMTDSGCPRRPRVRVLAGLSRGESAQRDLHRRPPVRRPLATHTPEGTKATSARFDALLARAKAMDPERLGTEDRVTLSALQELARRGPRRAPDRPARVGRQPARGRARSTS